jgi:glutamate-1-semialdehyde 2,1-aminomutase
MANASDSRVTLLPGGRLTQLYLPGGAYPTLTRGSGSHVWDTDGREYIDCVLGSGPLVLGHAHPAVVAAVIEQIRKGSTFYALNDKILDLARTIVDWAPCAEGVQFCTSGSEATFYALRIARAATGRDCILKFEGGFLGGNDYALMNFLPSVERPATEVRPSCAGIPQVLRDTVLVAPFNDIETTKALVQEHRSALAAIIVEPMQRVIEPRPGFLEGLRKLASDTGAVLIFDEVVSGFRWSPGGAQEYYGVTPDLATYGKIIGGGYPLAAVAGRRDLMEVAAWSPQEQEGRAYMSGTLNGNPVAAVAGSATLAELAKPDAYETLNRLGERLRDGISAAFRDLDMEGQVLGLGPTFQVVHSDHPVTDYRSLCAEDVAMKEAVAREVYEQGILVRNEKMYISMAHSDEDIDQIVLAYRNGLTRVGHS